MEQNYDFMSMGSRYAKEGIVHLSKMAEDIGKNYGVDAKMEFEAGICLTIPTYSSIVELSKNEIEKQATTHFGEENMRNNSYFGGNGVSHQYNGTTSIYNDPNKKRK